MIALNDLKFTEEEIDAILRIISSVQYFGNLRVDMNSYVEGSKACQIQSSQYWERLCALLEIDSELLETGLMMRELKIG